MRSWISRAVAAAGMLTALAGCPGSGGISNSVAVSGKVMYKGQPVEGATVSFVPQTEGSRASFGLTDSAGQFSLTTLKPGDGAIPGLYNVTVEKSTAPAPSAGPTSGLDPTTYEGMSAARTEYEQTKAKKIENEPSADLLPAKYKSAATSGLKADVQANGGNDFTFELTD